MSTTSPTGGKPGKLADVPRVQAYSDLVHSLPGFAASTVGEVETTRAHAARLELPYYCYICPHGYLWVCHPQGIGLSVLLGQTAPAVCITREQVVFVHWITIKDRPWPITVMRDEKGAFKLLRKGDVPLRLDRFDYHWEAAVSFGDHVAVPTDQGVAAILIGDRVEQSFMQLTDTESANPLVVPTGRGFLAYVPSNVQGAKAIVAYHDGKKFVEGFNQGEWEGSFMHLAALGDGSVLQVRPLDGGKAKLGIVPLETVKQPAVEEKIHRLAEKLGDDDADTRDQAHADLAAMGPAAWELLEKMAPTLPLEAQLRVRELTQAKTAPGLGRFKPVDDKLRVIWRLSDGGAVLLAESGVRMMAGKQEQVVAPAWIAIRPGRSISLLPPALTKSLAVGVVDLQAVGNDWVVSDPTDGARLFFGQELEPLTSSKLLDYRKVVGRDRMGRLLLTHADQKRYEKGFLLIDPAVADPTPVLNVWTMTLPPEGEVGWDGKDWPAVKRSGMWALKADQWAKLEGPLMQTEQAMQTETEGAVAFKQVGKLANQAGVWLNDQSMRLRQPDGTTTTQPRPKNLPPGGLVGVAYQNRFYLLHAGGKLSRLRVEPLKASPFTVEVVFDENIPDVAAVRRMWIDPAGRMCVATPDAELIVIFMERKIPQAMIDLIPAQELKKAAVGETPKP